jgi:hypothetical protein
MNRSKSLRFVCVGIMVCACLAAGAAPSASAALRLDVLSPTGQPTMAIPSGSQWSISGVQLRFNVTAGTDPNLDAASVVLYSIYSTSAGAGTTPAGLTRVDIGMPIVQSTTWSTQSVWHFVGEDYPVCVNVPFSYTATPNGKATLTPSSQDLDGDGDLDRGTTGPAPKNETDGTFWGGIDANQTRYSPLDSNGAPTGGASQLLYYWSPSSSLTFATVSLNHNAFSAQPYGHGITQILMVGKVGESAWKENGTMITDGTPTTGTPLTLYQTATALNTSGSLVLSPSSGAALLDGSTSEGTLDHWAWMVRKQGGSEWIPVTQANAGTCQLTFADLQAILGDNFGRYDLECITTWLDPSHQVTLPGDNMAASTFTQLDYTPEPATLLLLAAGSAGLALRRRRTKK